MAESAVPQSSEPVRRGGQSAGPTSKGPAAPFGFTGAAARLLMLQREVGNQVVARGLAGQASTAVPLVLQRVVAPTEVEANEEEGEQKTLGETPGGMAVKAQLASEPALKEPAGEQTTAEGTQQADAGGGEAGEPQISAELSADEQPHQSATDLEEIYGQAAEAKGTYEGIVAGIASSTGGKALFADLKGRPRAIEKMNTEYGGDASSLVDILRASISYQSFSQLKAGLALVSKQHRREGALRRPQGSAPRHREDEHGIRG